MEGKTSSGFVYSVAEGAEDDMELLEALIDIDEGKLSGIRNAITMLIGEDGKNALYEHCRVNGRVSATKVMEEIKEILEAMPGEIKN